jgi:hypothetical protein
MIIEEDDNTLEEVKTAPRISHNVEELDIIQQEMDHYKMGDLQEQ